MKPSLCCCLAILLLVIANVDSAPATKNDVTDDLSPLNENEEDDRGDRDKRKIGIVKLGVSNGLLNFVFGKLDAFLDAKTAALGVLDDSNRAKNAAYEIDSTKSATSEFISKFLQQKVRATSGSVGPLLNAGTTFLSTAGQGIAGAFVSKFAPLSSLSGGLAGGLSGSSSSGSGNNGDDDNGNGNAQGPGLSAGGGSNSGSFLTGLIGSLAGSSSGGSGNGGGGLGSLSSLSGGLSGGSNNGDTTTDNGIGVDFDDFPSAAGPDAPGNAGFANLGVSANAAAGYGYPGASPGPHQQYYSGGTGGGWSGTGNKAYHSDEDCAYCGEYTGGYQSSYAGKPDPRYGYPGNYNKW